MFFFCLEWRGRAFSLDPVRKPIGSNSGQMGRQRPYSAQKKWVFRRDVVGFLRVPGCSRGGGCSWGTLRIPREDWGRLGKIRED